MVSIRIAYVEGELFFTLVLLQLLATFENCFLPWFYPGFYPGFTPVAGHISFREFSY